MTACFDVWGDESTFFSCKDGSSKVGIQHDAQFALAFASAVATTSVVSWADVTYLCQSVGTPVTSLTAFGAASEAWASAIFYLMQGMANGPPSYQGMIGFNNPAPPMDHANYVPYDPSWFPTYPSPGGTTFIGTPTELGHMNTTTGCYERHYTHGVVELNASTTASCAFTAPTSAVDQFGDSVSGTITLAAISLTSDGKYLNTSNFTCGTPYTTGPYNCSAIVLVTP